MGNGFIGGIIGGIIAFIPMVSSGTFAGKVVSILGDNIALAYIVVPLLGFIIGFMIDKSLN